MIDSSDSANWADGEYKVSAWVDLFLELVWNYFPLAKYTMLKLWVGALSTNVMPYVQSSNLFAFQYQ